MGERWLGEAETERGAPYAITLPTIGATTVDF
jgi:hypothetical protein